MNHSVLEVKPDSAGYHELEEGDEPESQPDIRCLLVRQREPPPLAAQARAPARSAPSEEAAEARLEELPEEDHGPDHRDEADVVVEVARAVPEVVEAVVVGQGVREAEVEVIGWGVNVEADDSIEEDEELLGYVGEVDIVQRQVRDDLHHVDPSP